MQLYVLRHAIAEDRTPRQSDSERRLTPLGVAKAARVLAHARKIGVQPGTVLTSPYVRASQTAEIAREQLRLSAPAVVTEALIPYVNVFDLWEGIRDHFASGDVMVVGHNPQLSSLVSWLLGSRQDALWLKKSGLVALDVGTASSQPRAMLAWLLTPGSVGK